VSYDAEFPTPSDHGGRTYTITATLSPEFDVAGASCGALPCLFVAAPASDTALAGSHTLTCTLSGEAQVTGTLTCSFPAGIAPTLTAQLSSLDVRTVPDLNAGGDSVSLLAPGTATAVTLGSFNAFADTGVSHVAATLLPVASADAETGASVATGVLTVTAQRPTGGFQDGGDGSDGAFDLVEILLPSGLPAAVDALGLCWVWATAEPTAWASLPGALATTPTESAALAAPPASPDATRTRRLRAPGTRTATAGVFAPVSVAGVSSLFVACEFIASLPSAALTDASVRLRFASSLSGRFLELSDLGAAPLLTFDPAAPGAALRPSVYDLTLRYTGPAGPAPEAAHAAIAAAAAGPTVSASDAPVSVDTRVTARTAVSADGAVFSVYLHVPPLWHGLSAALAAHTNAQLTAFAADVVTQALTAAGSTATAEFSALATAEAGRWLCADSETAAPGGHDVCRPTPAGCSPADTFQGAPACVTPSTGVPATAVFACVFTTGAPTAAADYSSCDPRISLFTTTVLPANAGTGVPRRLEVNYISDPFNLAPTLAVTLTLSRPGLFGWAALATTPADLCPESPTGVSCALDAATGALTVTIDAATGSGSFCLAASFAEWADGTDVLIVTAAVDVATQSSVLADGAVVVMPLTDTHNVAAATATATDLAFAVDTVADAGAGPTAPAAMGTLRISVSATTAGAALAATSNAGAASALLLSLPSGWALGSACTVLTAPLTALVPWPAALTTLAPAVVSADPSNSGRSRAALAVPGLDLSAVTALHVVCAGVSAPPASAGATAAAAVSLGFEGPGAAYLVTTPTAALWYDPAPAPDMRPLYVAFTLTAGSSDAAPAPTQVSAADLKAAMLGSASAALPATSLFAGLAFAAPFDGDTGAYALAVGFAGGARALIPLFAAEPAIANLAGALPTLLSLPSSAWAYVPGSIESGAQGGWRCEDAPAGSGAFSECTVTPRGCSSTFPSEPACLVPAAPGGAPPAGPADPPTPCLLTLAPEPAVESEDCLPVFIDLTLTYNATASVLEFTYSLQDAAQFVGAPVVTVSLTHAPALFFAYPICAGGSMAGAAITGAVSCAFNDATSSLDVVLGPVSASGGFTLPVAATKYVKTPVITFNAATAAFATILDSDVSTSVTLPPLRHLVVTGGLAHASVAVASASACAVVLTLVAPSGPAGAALAPGFDAPIAGVSVTLDAATSAGSSIGDTCTLHLSTMGAAAWPLSLLPLSGNVMYATDVVSGARTATFAVTSGVPMSSVTAVFLSCPGVPGADATAVPVPLSVALTGADLNWLVDFTPPLSGGVQTARVTRPAAAAWYLAFAAELSTAAVDVAADDAYAAYAAAALGHLAGSITAAFASVNQSGDAVTAMLSLSAGARSWGPALASASAVTALAAGPLSTVGAAQAAPAGGYTWMARPDVLLESGFAGEWLCGKPLPDAVPYAACTVVNNCGEAYVNGGDAACILDGAPAASPLACALAPLPPALPVSTGCGAWRCRDAAGAFVACDAPAVCFDGCEAAVAVVVDVAAGEHLNPSLRGGRFQQFCVSPMGSLLTDAAAVAAFCPPRLYAAYAPVCDASSTCRLHCRTAAGEARSCFANTTWGTCDADCGPGQQQRLTYCSAAPLAHGAAVSAAATVVADALCSAARDASQGSAVTPGFELARSCSGHKCTAYRWQCLASEADAASAAASFSAGDPVDCTGAAAGDERGYSNCAGVCGSARDTRAVVCAGYVDAAGTGALTLVTTAADELLCSARALKPANSRPCPGDRSTGDGACVGKWSCYPVGGDPFAATTCTSGGSVTCPTTGCHPASAPRRNVACYDTVTGARAPAARCGEGASAISKPVDTGACGAVVSGCRADFFGSTCDIYLGTSSAVQDSSVSAAAAGADADPAPETGRVSDYAVTAYEGKCVSFAGQASGWYRQGTCVDGATGTIVEGGCSSDSLLSQCALPPCLSSDDDTVTFAWASVPGTCVPGCVSYRPVSVICFSVITPGGSSTGSGTDISVIVDNSFCTGLPERPAAYAACEPTPCANGGVCDASAPVRLTDGTLYPGLLGVCQCSVGFGGALCTKDASINASSVSVDASAGTATWSFTHGDPAAVPYVTMAVTLAPPSTSEAFATASLASAAPLAAGASTGFTVTLPANSGFNAATGASTASVPALLALAPGTYTAVLDTGVVGLATAAATFIRAPACPGDCANGGSCDTATGTCVCSGPYAGPLCEEPACAAAACHGLTGVCDLDANDSATCVCAPSAAGALTGTRCESFTNTAVTCAALPACGNGAARVPLLTPAGALACGACQCTGYWAGDRCTECTLQCQNGGMLSAGSSSACRPCTCPAGYHGDACEWRHILLTLNFRRSDAIEWYFASASGSVSALAAPAVSGGSSAALTQWFTALARNLATLSGDAALSVTVLSHRYVSDGTGGEFVQLKLAVGHFSGLNNADNDLFAPYAAARRLRAHLGGDAVEPASRNALGLPALSSLYLGRGVGLTDPNCDDVGAEVGCPAGTGAHAVITAAPRPVEEGGGSSGLSRDAKIAIGVCVGVGGFLLLLLLLFCILTRRRKPKQATEDTRPSAAAATATAAETADTADAEDIFYDIEMAPAA
jgi:hypothetical protein